jgi:hypothetical protein
MDEPFPHPCPDVQAKEVADFPRMAYS